MMMMFIGIAILLFGIFLWQYLDNSDDFDWDHEEKPKGIAQSQETSLMSVMQMVNSRAKTI